VLWDVDVFLVLVLLWFLIGLALGIGKQELRATASLLARCGPSYRGERSEKPDRRERPDNEVIIPQHRAAPTNTH
jgi:hypothetical protein